MTTTFDNKVYDIIKDGGDPSPGPDPGPDPEIGFDDVYPVGSTYTSKSFTIPLKQGTWQLVGVYGFAQNNIQGVDYDYIFNKQSVMIIMHSEYSKEGYANWTCDFSSALGSYTIEAIIGQGFQADGTFKFYDDYIETRNIGGWTGQYKDTNKFYISSTGGIVNGRNYELTFLIKLSDLNTVVSSFATFPLSYEFERTN